jgi:hypothetical protein
VSFYAGIEAQRAALALILTKAATACPVSIIWLEKARSAAPAKPFKHLPLAAAYALSDDLDRVAIEFSVARRLGGEGSFSSIAKMKAGGWWRSLSPRTRALFEATYFAGLRKAGVPEE